MTRRDELLALAKSLTAAQRDVMTRLTDTQWTPAFMLSTNHQGLPAAYALRPLARKGFVESRMGGAQCLVYRLTPLGLALRDHLKQQESADER